MLDPELYPPPDLEGLREEKLPESKEGNSGERNPLQECGEHLHRAREQMSDFIFLMKTSSSFSTSISSSHWMLQEVRGQKACWCRLMSISQDTDPGKKVGAADLKRQRNYQLWYNLKSLWNSTCLGFRHIDHYGSQHVGTVALHKRGTAHLW